MLILGIRLPKKRNRIGIEGCNQIDERPLPTSTGIVHDNTKLSEYERSFRPIAQHIQAEAVDIGLATFFPETEEAINTRNAYLTGS